MTLAEIETGAAASPVRLKEALEVARGRYRAANAGSAERHARACGSLPGGNTRTILFHAPFPLFVERGEGAHLWDVDGHRYVNLLGEYTAGLFGHDHPRIREALREALDGGLSLSSHTAHEARLAEAICARFPSIDLVRFTNSGTEANLMALAAATAITGRRKVLVFDGGYHGGVLNFGSGHAPTNVPHDYVLVDYNDAAAAARAFREHGADLAAVLVEPMLGAGGCVPADPGFMRLLRDEASRCGALLIVDEVMTSRLSFGGWQAQSGIHADLTTLGKYIGGGMSFGAFGGRRDLMRWFDPSRAGAFSHAGTFNNNVLTMRAGFVGLTEIYTEPVARALSEAGDDLRRRLNALAADGRLPMTFTGLGSLATVHFTDRPVRNAADVRAADQALKELFFFDMLDRGFYLARRGMYALSLAIRPDHRDGFVDAVSRFVDARRGLLRERAAQAGGLAA